MNKSVDQKVDAWSSRERLSAGRKWRAQAEILGRGMTAALADIARIEPGMRVLDLASGEGDPALTLASMAGRHGSITATDISPGPLQTAAARAREAGLGNISFQVADAQRLPFGDAVFDRVTCRCGLMFFAEPVAAMREAWRVLKAGGRLALIVWGSIQQPYFQVFIAPLVRRVPGPALAADGPNPFKFAEEGKVSSVLRQAGFRDVREEARIVERIWPASPEEAWQYFRDHAAPFRPLIERVPADEWEHVSREVFASFAAFRVAGGYDFRAQIVLAEANK